MGALLWEDTSTLLMYTTGNVELQLLLHNQEAEWVVYYMEAAAQGVRCRAVSLYYACKALVSRTCTARVQSLYMYLLCNYSL